MGNVAWCFLPDTLPVKNKHVHFLSAVSPPSPWPITFPKITSLIHWKDFVDTNVFNVLWLTDLKIWMLLGSRPGWSHPSLLWLILFHFFNEKSQEGDWLEWKRNVNMRFHYQSLYQGQGWSDDSIAVLYYKWMNSQITTFIHKTYMHFQALSLLQGADKSGDVINTIW